MKDIIVFPQGVPLDLCPLVLTFEETKGEDTDALQLKLYTFSQEFFFFQWVLCRFRHLWTLTPHAFKIHTFIFNTFENYFLLSFVHKDLHPVS